MTDTPPPEPEDPLGEEPPPPDALPPVRPANLPVSPRGQSIPKCNPGAPRLGAIPRVENVRVTATDLARRVAMRKTRRRLSLAAIGFGVLFLAVAGKLADATLIQPLHPRPLAALPTVTDELDKPPPAPMLKRAMILDRNNQILAISLPTAELYANPREMIDPIAVAHRLKLAVPRLDEKEMRERLASGRAFVYLARRLSPREELTINDLGIPGIYFQPSERRHYPLGRVAAQILGGVDIDEHGVAGIEKAEDKRLATDATPLRLSIDVRVQAVVREELSAAMDEFKAIGACGLVMDVRTGEVLAMVSLPDYDANKFGDMPPNDRFNRAVTGMYEPGSTFKLQTASMALHYGTAHLWDTFDAADPIHIGRFTITDFKGKHRWLYLPEVLAYSSNLGAAHIALTVGAERQRAWLKAMGMFARVPIELPEAGLPIVPSASRWGEATVMTVGFGHGIAVSPLHVVRGVAAIANGGILVRPTLLAEDDPAGPEPNVAEPNVAEPSMAEPSMAEPNLAEPNLAEPNVAEPSLTEHGPRLMSEHISYVMRKLMRLVVTDGYGKKADVPGYFVGGKTGTAEKAGAHGYKKHTNVSAFVSVFPMYAPRYSVYIMLDEPHGDKSTGFYSTAGQVSAPAAGRVIARIGPMLGVFPLTKDLDAVEASLRIPLQPARGYMGGPVAAEREESRHAARDATPERREARVRPAMFALRDAAAPRLPPRSQPRGSAGLAAR